MESGKSVVWWITQGDTAIQKPQKLGNPACSWSYWTRVMTHCYLSIGVCEEGNSEGHLNDLLNVSCIVLIGNETFGRSAKFLRDRGYKGKIVMMQDGGILYPITLMSESSRKEFFECLKDPTIISGVITMHPSAQEIYKLWTKLPVKQLGIPYPMEFKRYMKPFHERDVKKIIVGGLVRAKRNAELALFILKDKFPDLDPDVRNTTAFADTQKISKMEEVKQTIVNDMGLNVKLRRYCKVQEDYIQQVSDGYTALYLDDIGSVGRFPMDMACLGIPTVVSSKSYSGSVLFPDLVVDNMDLLRTEYLLTKLLQDNQFYTECSLKARYMLDGYFGIAQCQERFIRIFADFGVGTSL